jgi:hypothetical protein
MAAATAQGQSAVAHNPRQVYPAGLSGRFEDAPTGVRPAGNGNDLAAAQFRVGACNLPQSSRDARLLHGRECRDEAHRQKAVNDDLLGAANVPVLEYGLFGIGEKIVGELPAPCSRSIARSIAFVGLYEIRTASLIGGCRL